MRSLSVSPSLESKKTPKVVVVFSSPPLGCSIFAFQLRGFYIVFSQLHSNSISKSPFYPILWRCASFSSVFHSLDFSAFSHCLGTLDFPASPSRCLQILVFLDHILHFEHCKFLGKLSCHLAGNIPQYWWTQPYVWTIKVVLEFWFGHSKCHFFGPKMGTFCRAFCRAFMTPWWCDNACSL